MRAHMGCEAMKLRDIVARVNEWAIWAEKMHSSGLGYPAHASETRAQSGGRRTPGPIVPQFAAHPKAVEVDRCIREMPDDLRTLIVYRHLAPGKELDKVRTYASEYGLSMSGYYRREKDAYWWIGGYLAAQKKVG